MQETPLQPIVYSLQFRGRITSLSSRVLEQRASAPSQVLITTVDANGLAGDVQPGEGKEALLVSRLVLADDGSFDQSGTIEFAAGHVLAFRSVGAARLTDSPDPNLRHGAAIWEIEGGEGQFHGARGRITSNFFMSDTNELTDNHFGLIFVARAAATPASEARTRAPLRRPGIRESRRGALNFVNARVLTSRGPTARRVLGPRPRLVVALEGEQRPVCCLVGATGFEPATARHPADVGAMH